MKQMLDFVKNGLRDMFHIWREELKSVFKDEGVMIFFFLVPLAYPVLYSFIYNNEVVHEAKMVVVDADNSPLSREFIRRVDASSEVKVVQQAADLGEAQRLVDSKEAFGILSIPESFSRDLHAGRQTTVSLYSDMSALLYYKAFLLTATEVSLDMGAEWTARNHPQSTEQLQAICGAVPALYRQRDKTAAQLEKRLRACNICALEVDELDGRERKQAERWFRDYVAPVLSPLVVDLRHPFPHLPSKSLAVVLTLRQGGQRRIGLVPVPRALPPFLRLEEGGLRYLLTERVVLHFADTLFEGCQVEEKCVISVTRNADISPEDEDYDVGEDFRAHMQKVLKKRGRMAPVRLELSRSLEEELGLPPLLHHGGSGDEKAGEIVERQR